MERNGFLPARTQCKWPASIGCIRSATRLTLLSDVHYCPMAGYFRSPKRFGPGPTVAKNHFLRCIVAFVCSRSKYPAQPGLKPVSGVPIDVLLEILWRQKVETRKRIPTFESPVAGPSTGGF